MPALCYRSLAGTGIRQETTGGLCAPSCSDAAVQSRDCAVSHRHFNLYRLNGPRPARHSGGEAGAARVFDQLRERFWLDQPMYVQLWRYVSGIAMLDFGYSWLGVLVFDLIMDRFATLLLTGTAFVLSLVLYRVYPWRLPASRNRRLADRQRWCSTPHRCFGWC